MLNLMFAELDQHIFPSEDKSDVCNAAGNLEVTDNGKTVNVEDVLTNAQNTVVSVTQILFHVLISTYFRLSVTSFTYLQMTG